MEVDRREAERKKKKRIREEEEREREGERVFSSLSKVNIAAGVWPRSEIIAAI